MIKKREKLRKHRRKKKYRENEEKITDRYRFIGCNSGVLFFVDKEEKCTEKKKIYSTVNGKVSQSPKKKFF